METFVVFVGEEQTHEYECLQIQCLLGIKAALKKDWPGGKCWEWRQMSLLMEDNKKKPAKKAHGGSLFSVLCKQLL